MTNRNLIQHGVQKAGFDFMLGKGVLDSQHKTRSFHEDHTQNVKIRMVTRIRILVKKTNVPTDDVDNTNGTN